jgi:hypothetical protein
VKDVSFEIAVVGVVFALFAGLVIGVVGSDSTPADFNTGQQDNNFTYKTADKEHLSGNLTGWNRYYYIEGEWRNVVLVESDNESRLYLEGDYIPHQGETR